MTEEAGTTEPGFDAMWAEGEWQQITREVRAAVRAAITGHRVRWWSPRAVRAAWADVVADAALHAPTLLRVMARLREREGVAARKTEEVVLSVREGARMRRALERIAALADEPGPSPDQPAHRPRAHEALLQCVTEARQALSAREDRASGYKDA